MLYLKRLYAFSRAVTALLWYHQKPNRAVFRDRAVKISVHYSALYSPPRCISFLDILVLVEV